MTGGRRPKILFVRNQTQRFVMLDLDLLRKDFAVQDWHVTSRTVNVIATLRAVAASDAVFCWFASWHSALPVLAARMLKRPALVVVGGYDTANVPEAGYGSQRGGLRRVISRMVMANATHLITNSQSARRETVEAVGINPEKISVVYHGVELPALYTWTQKQRLVITVGGVWRENLLRKGLLPFTQAACLLPDVRFAHAGKWYDDSIHELRDRAPSNVEFKGFLPDEALTALYLQASVYVQASLHEGFGMSVAEAMLAGCIPVVTHVGALPEVVGDLGIYIDRNTPDAISAGIKAAFQVEEGIRHRAAERIQTLFPLEARQRALHDLVRRHCD